MDGRMKLSACLTLMIVIIIFLSGCRSGVSQQEYRKVCDERDEIQMKLEIMEASVEEASSYIQVLTASTNMSTEATLSEITEITSSMAATGDKELVAKGMVIGQMFAGDKSGQISGEVNRVVMDWFGYIAEKIGDALAEATS